MPDILTAPVLGRLHAALAPRYRLERELGRGGMATVFLAHDLKHDRQVAVKVLHPALAAAIGPERFVDEIRLTAGLNHPHILPLLDSGEADGFLYYAMPYVEGESLRNRLSWEGGLPIAEALGFARQLADALDYAHRHGIVHRDVKPENILLSEGQALLADFGIALALTRAASDRLTGTGLAIGTPRYMSPEQTTGGREIDGRSDIYSLGCVIYEMVAGRPPFERAALVRPSPARLRAGRRPASADIERVVLRCLQTAPEARYPTARDLSADLTACQATLTTRTVRFGVLVRRPGVLAALVALGVVLAATGAWLWRRESRIRWARTVALPEAARLVEEGRHYAAFRMLRRAEAVIPGDPVLHGLLMESTILVTVHTTPPGAQVYVRDFGAPPETRDSLGPAPLEEIRLPAAALVWQVLLDGFQPLEGLRVFRRRSVEFELQPAQAALADMVHVSGGPFTLFDMPQVELGDYWMDRYEVTNRRFKAFMDGGGYERREFWTSLAAPSSGGLSWEEARRLFRDGTGRPGPSTWELGTYPDGQADYPVGGISWYEAAAYCASVGRELPTAYHWYHAADLGTTLQFAGSSNFSAAGPVPVGRPQSVGAYGTYDMAGNVKEWVLNRADPARRYILGGGWNEPEYQYREHDAQSPSDREPTFGVRCAKYPAPLTGSLVNSVAPPSADQRQEVPVSDEVFEVYRSLYQYDRLPLEARVDSVDDRAERWRVERVSFAAAYGNERVSALLFLPTVTPAPYQTVIFAPGAGAFIAHQRFGEAEGQREWFLFLVRSGRAVMVPMFKGTFERYVGPLDQPNVWRDVVIDASKDLGRSIDYLESRPDIDARRLAFYGLSAGAGIGQILTAIEPRFRASILIGSGLMHFSQPPESRAVNFLPRIRTPTLMINGRKDSFFPLETAQEPMFRLLGTPQADKRHRVFDSGHIPTEWQQVMGETLDWLDRYLGPVGGSRKPLPDSVAR